MPNMAVSALVMSSRCTSWVWARIQARRETRWSSGTTTWSSALKTGIMISGVWTVLWCTQAPGGTTIVTSPTWTGSTWGTWRAARESTGTTTKTTAFPWSLPRWSCGRQVNLLNSTNTFIVCFLSAILQCLYQSGAVFRCPIKPKDDWGNIISSLSERFYRVHTAFATQNS